jgi:hypothetical protein
MRFASPIWLILLMPWAGLVIWLLRGRLPAHGVPFLNLWSRESAMNPRPKRAWIAPPAAILAVLAGMFLAVIGAATPMIEDRHDAAPAPAPMPDVRIESLAVRAAPTTQAMIQLTNRSSLTTAVLTVRAGDVAVVRNVELPAHDDSRNYFVDLPTSSSTVDAEVSAGANGEIDHHLKAIRRPAWPIVEPRSPLPAEVSRMIEVYSRDRATSEESKHVAVEVASNKMSADEPVAILMDESSSQIVSSAQPVTVRDSPLTESVDWDSALPGAKVKSPPGEDWRAIVSAGNIPVVAIREEPVRQVWVGFVSEALAHRADFVVFWSNVFAWLGGADANDQITAANAEPIAQTPVLATGTGRPIAGYLFLAALVMMILSAVSWKKGNMRR